MICSHRVKHTLSTAYTEYSIHWVQHSPSTASIQDFVSSLHSDDYDLTPEYSFSFRRASPCQLKSNVTLSHSHLWMVTNWWRQFQHPAPHPSNASQYLSKVAWGRPARSSPNSLDYGLQTPWIMACSCISILARLCYPRLHDPGLQEHPQTCSITNSKCISKLSPSRPPSASPNSLDYSLLQYLLTRVIKASNCLFKFARSQRPIASPNPQDRGLQEHHQTNQMMAPEWISGFIQSSFSCAPRIGLKHHLQPVQIYRVDG